MPDRYAVVGHPIAHSRSPEIHAAFAAQTGQDLVYERLLAPLDGFEATVDAFAREGGRGLNVTQPFKTQAFALAATRAARAERAGAANTLVHGSGIWHADNTDGFGLVRDLVHNLRVPLARRAILILGAGGATRGVLGPLLAQSPAKVVIANRTVARAQTLAREFSALGPVQAAGTDATDGRFDLVINATSAEFAGEVPQWPEGAFADGAVAYDMSYRDAPTAFLRWAAERGAARTADGLGMLIEQAAESFFLWRGVRPETGPVFGLLRQ